MDAWNSSLISISFFLVLLPCLYGQTCPSSAGPFQPVCSQDVLDNSWLSNIMGSSIPTALNSTSAMVSLTWTPDPSVSQRRPYRVFSRILDSGEQYLRSMSTSSFDMFNISNLTYNTRYEVLVCYANITSKFLDIDSEFIPECGFCRTCFRTEDRVITSATVTDVVVSSEVESKIYECRVIGFQGFQGIAWRGRQGRNNSFFILTDGRDGAEISSSTENDETVSVLRLRGNLESISCRVGIPGSGIVTRTNFQQLDPIFAFINITEATLNRMVLSSSGVVVQSIYTCLAVGIPLPLNISWRAAERDALTDGTFGVEIMDTVEDTGASSVLSFSGTDFSSVVCIVTNGNYPGVMEGEFQEETTVIDDITEGDTTGNTVSIAIYTIVLLVVMPLVILPVLVVLSILLYRKFCGSHRHKSIIKAMGLTTRLTLAVPLEELGGSSLKPESSNNVAVLKAKLPEDMFIPPADLNVSSIIGQGEFGVIYKAYMQSTDNQTRAMVAVKTLKGVFATSSDVEKATEEILKMSHFDHPNVMTLIGVCVAPSEQGSSSMGPSIVMPFMDNGSLLDYLRKEADNLVATSDDEIPKVRKPLVQICQQVAKGMEYLAKMKFVHRDLAARNCLMCSSGVIKISDFGLTEDVYTRNYFRQAKDGAKLPLKWMALESIKLGVFSEKSDVWSYGVTVWEVFSGGAIPYPGIHPRAILEYLEEGERLPKPKNAACCSETYSLLQSCWDAKPEERPTFTEILQKLEYFLESMSEYVVLSGLRNDGHSEDDKNSEQAYFRASPIEQDREHSGASLQIRIHAAPNDYCIAEI